ncbi:hypothetical protein SAMN05192558_11911 [Actinokineospora alba]|uniref:Uncharacterized protein n=1 Tax=Actinokineospora alba TaxID=504798 RepID=A0A1H0W9M9_9PSEU|nr:hypothetical protein [Actinokineospora alba]TDP66214.1 hypothetical protein C8E96_1714 [Actinokineospora alba]SDJ43117.1 hypothetical protein SAMN05421871_11595 [Actinokineospora alba]SDP87338.1 hypothetical protein SAMN05192558_11911 [Actinokineospora alba]
MERLRTLVDGPAPTPKTTLDTVIRRGRRRVWARQAGTGLGVLALVGVVGAGALVLRPAAPDQIMPADTPTTVDWPRIDARTDVRPEPFQPAMSAPVPPGRALVDAPSCYQNIPDGRMMTRPGVVDSSPELRQAFVESAQVLAPPAKVGELTQNPGPNNLGYYRYEVDVTDSHGTGSVSIRTGTFTGDPVTAADERAFELSNCDPPQRKVLPDGTVLQLYSVRASEPFQSLTRSVFVFRPGGKLYEVAMHNFGSPDFAPNPVQPEHPSRVRAGRDTLPLTEVQLAGIAERIAQVG